MSRADALLYAQKQREFASEEAEREAATQAAHKKNLRLATSICTRRVWRVRLNATCEIMEIVEGQVAHRYPANSVSAARRTAAAKVWTPFAWMQCRQHMQRH